RNEPFTISRTGYVEEGTLTGVPETSNARLVRIPPVPSVAMNEGIFTRVSKKPLTNPKKRPIRMQIGYTQYPTGLTKTVKTTEMNEIKPPTERSMPPMRMAHICPKATMRSTAAKLAIVFKL